MYRPIYETALEKGLPAAFVGTGWETWDDVGNLKEGDFARMREMHDSHRLLPFPPDGSHTTFSSTCLYWLARPEGDEKTGSDKKTEGEEDETVAGKTGEDEDAEKDNDHVSASEKPAEKSSPEASTS